ncbi:MAG: molybdopterin-dependent oxidoreductase [Betaproteobacteria bacterium]|nr:molybdopterin-dependent oxidoreductase [Betaproteobacteria bacterium]
MNKRDFLAASALGAALVAPPVLAQGNLKGPPLLTVTGLIGAGNRGAMDPALDQLMSKQKVAFDKAFVFDFAALQALPKIQIKPTIEYDAKPHTISGPLLTDVVRAAGATPKALHVFLRAVDGYVVPLSLADAAKYRYIVATELDGKPMPLGGLGPLWAVYDADRYPDMMAKTLAERYTFCPWGLFHIELRSSL